MEILLVASAFNSLTQRVYAELSDRRHRVEVVLAAHGDDEVRRAVRDVRPDLVVAPILRTALPKDVWAEHTCLVVHPGPPGDRGPSSLDWAIAGGATRWGVTVLQAEEDMDAGPVWASVPFDVVPAGKSDLYRNEVADAAVAAVLLAVERYAGGTYEPRPQDDDPDADVTWRPAVRQEQRRIDWDTDTTATVLRKLRAADSRPGVLDELCGAEVFLHGGHPEDRLRGSPGELLATRTGAVCRATRDGAVWIPELRARRRPGGPPTFRLPATHVLGPRRLAGVPEAPVAPELAAGRRTWSDIHYRQDHDVGFLRFSFPGGAMSTDQCRRLLDAYRHALTRPTRVLVLGGARDFFSNGIHLNVIEAATDPAAESWANLNAMDDLVEAVLRTTDRLVVAALAGNAAAGGVMLALAADQVWCRAGAVLNPHYRRMGLYGSEFWTYTLPHRAGPATTERLMTEALPVSAATAVRLGLADRLVTASPQDFAAETERLAAQLARSPDLDRAVTAKQARRARHEADRPLDDHRRAELAEMHRIFFDPHAPYHALRSAFVRKEAGGPPRPLTAPRALRATRRP
ncbi:hydrogenase maturation protein [Streptomyces mashuensis]|uniref:Hydrogenase maturation protein n=1 Tax=Streptomyces mashuensis TaxID=33904 RepID=A0A919B9D5_9ACTN|nr:enoyl-CoA hydratase-related protein [Streptomyces mashuensis]GHF71728.1 hydrogenase maturation protein [Streptomyces mashuensis]